MGRIDESLLNLENMPDRTERAFHLAGLISTLFKIRGVVLLLTGQLAFDIYANSSSDQPELDLAIFSGKIEPRLLLDVMRGQLRARGHLAWWQIAGLPVRFHGEASIVHRDLCRDFTTDNGVVKLLPVEEITADRILAATYPEPDNEAHTEARLLLINGLSDVFHMDWPRLHSLCHRPEYRVGEELAQLRLAAKKDVDAIGSEVDSIGQSEAPPDVTPELPEKTA